MHLYGCVQVGVGGCDCTAVAFASLQLAGSVGEEDAREDRSHRLRRARLSTEGTTRSRGRRRKGKEAPTVVEQVRRIIHGPNAKVVVRHRPRQGTDPQRDRVDAGR